MYVYVLIYIEYIYTHMTMCACVCVWVGVSALHQESPWFSEHLARWLEYLGGHREESRSLAPAARGGSAFCCARRQYCSILVEDMCRIYQANAIHLENTVQGLTAAMSAELLDDAKSFGAFKKSKEPATVVSHWSEINVPQVQGLYIYIGK